MNLTLENFRGFAGRHQLAIKPITLIVGENSSGKTTLLAAIAAALQSGFPSIDFFNRPPFELGSYDTIATYRGGKYGRAPSFGLGWEHVEDGESASINAQFSSYLGVPRLSNLEVNRGPTRLHGNPIEGTWELTYEDEAGILAKVTFRAPSKLPVPFYLSELPRYYALATYDSTSSPKNRAARIDADKAITALRSIAYLPFDLHGVVALAPLRTRPHRTYDKLIEEFSPDGDHTPLVLARLLAGDSAIDLAAIKSLEAFGISSGLFEKLKVKRMGRQASDPFQLRVKSVGPDANLVDVGYGVSQALPIVVESILSPAKQTILIQQPEVHLHPKAQAALGTFFCELSIAKDQSFVIETHSDYLVDRVRIAVAQGMIAPDSVSIAYLERKKLDITIHQLSLDSKGNIINAPHGYREFFLREEMNLILRSQNVINN